MKCGYCRARRLTKIARKRQQEPLTDNPRETPMIRRVEIVDKSEAYLPRISIDFFDWNFAATPSPDMFTFNKPADAKEVQIPPEMSKKR